MSFVSVDFYGARQMAGEITAMGADCAAMAAETGLEELTKLAADLAGIAADVRRAWRQAGEAGQRYPAGAAPPTTRRCEMSGTYQEQAQKLFQMLPPSGRGSRKR